MSNGEYDARPDDYFDDEYEPDEFEEEMSNCHGWFDPDPETGVFTCGAAGSEDCDECPMNSWCGLTSKQIDELEGIESDEA